MYIGVCFSSQELRERKNVCCGGGGDFSLQEVREKQMFVYRGVVFHYRSSARGKMYVVGGVVFHYRSPSRGKSVVYSGVVFHHMCFVIYGLPERVLLLCVV